MKKIIGILIAMIMVLSLSVAAFAADPSTGNVFAEVSKDFDAAGWEYSDGVIFVPDADGTITVDVTAFSADEAPEGFVTDLFNYDTLDWGGEYYATEAGKVEYSVAAGYTYVLYVYPAAVNGGFMNWGTSGSVTYSVSSDVNCVISEIREPEPGETENNPIYFDTDTYTVVIPANTTVWYAFDDSMDMWNNGIYEQQYTVSGNTGFGVFIGYESYADTDGVVTGTAYGSYMGYYVFGLTNNTAEEQTYTVTFVDVVGGDDEDDDPIIDEPTGGVGGDIAYAENEEVSDANPWTYTFTIDSTGVLNVNIGECNPGWRYKILYPDGVESLYKNDFNTGVNGSFDLVDLGEYTIMLWAYSAAEYSNVDGTVSCEVIFTPNDVETDIPKEEYIYSNTILDLGENDLTMEPNAENTLFEFTPSQIGTYTFTSPEGILIGDWNTSTYPYDKTGDGKTNVVVWECTSVGQSIMIGVAGEESIILNVEKTAAGQVEDQIEYEAYIPTHVPTAPNLIDLTDNHLVSAIDITKPQTVVKDENGFYHLGSVNGPVIYANLISDSFDLTQAFFGGYGALTMRGECVGENGEILYYDFLNAMRIYATVLYDSDYENGLYPLTDDLMMFLKGYGAYQGWYNPNLSPFEAISGEFDENSAWLASCVTAQVVSDYRVVGNADWLGNWDPANEAGRMFEVGDGIYQITFSGVAAGEYELKVTKGSWDENWGEGGANGGNVKFEVLEGKDLTVTFNAKTGEITIVNGSNVNTGDHSIAGLVIAMLAASAGAVVLTKKKEF